jgi:FHA domain
MATCPSGHDSTDDEFCDVCGFAIGGPVAVRETVSPAVRAAVSSTVASQNCPRCGVRRAGQFCEACGYDFSAAVVEVEPPPVTRIEPAPTPAPTPRAAPPAAAPAPAVSAPAAPLSSAPVPAAAAPSAPATATPGGADWTAVVTADRAYYDSVQAAGGPDVGGIAFPVYCPQRRFRLAGTEVRVGRRSAHSGIEPEIDLTGPPADPGVSRLHAVLLKAADGSWSVVDPGSANGTLVNGTEIAPDKLVPLRDGDRIHLGAWTELRIARER